MRIRVLSDLHLEFGDWAPPFAAADVVVLAGDIHKSNRAVEWIKRHFADVPVIYIAGNHEFYGSNTAGVISKIRESVAGSLIRFLENEETEIKGTVFLGCTLWTDFNLFGSPEDSAPAVVKAMNDYRKIRVVPGYRRLSGRDTAGFHRNSRRWLEGALLRNAGRNVVVVSHHAPSAKSLPPESAQEIVSAAYASCLDELVETSRAQLWIHGHTHRSVEYQLGSTRVLSNQKGYPDQKNTGFVSNLVAEI
jgi:predicted phosphohydrolase